MRNICGIRRVDRVRNAIIKERCGCELSVVERTDERNVLKWLGHVERMGGEGQVKRVYRVNVNVGGNRRERDHREDERMKCKICCWGES